MGKPSESSQKSEISNTSKTRSSVAVRAPLVMKLYRKLVHDVYMEFMRNFLTPTHRIPSNSSKIQVIQVNCTMRAAR